MTDVIARIRALYAEGRFAETVEFIRTSIASASLPPPHWKLVANAATRLNDRYAAARAADHWLHGEPNGFDAMQFAVQARAGAGEIQSAVALSREIVARFSNIAHAHYAAAEVTAQLGEIDEAIALFKRTFAMDSRFIACWEHISRLKKFKSGDPDLDVIATLVERSQALGPSFLISAHYAQANSLDGLGEYDGAFPHYLEAARHVRETSPYSVDRLLAPLRQGVAAFTEDFIAANSGAGSDASQPIFIIGPPRSGTTLVEQILASHPMVTGGGETLALRLAYWPLGEFEPETIASRLGADANIWNGVAEKYLAYTRELFGSAERISNKEIGSIAAIGLIRLALPNAKIIFCHRDPMDVAWSCMKAHFGASIAWSFDFDHIAQFLAEFTRAQYVWRERMGGILRVRYEDVVADQRRETDRILTFCDLPHDEACYEFHKTVRQVSTASIAQVLQPLFSTSVGGWRKYERHLAPLAEALTRNGLSFA